VSEKETRAWTTLIAFSWNASLSLPLASSTAQPIIFQQQKQKHVMSRFDENRRFVRLVKSSQIDRSHTMPPTDTSLTFFAAAVLLALAPGPDNVFVLLYSAQHGKRAGMLVVLGLCSGLLFHTAAVALGLAAVLATSPTAFTLLKLCGAAYLVWLAWGAWTAPLGMSGTGSSAAMTPGKTYTRGVLMNVTNPKVAIFFLAFLPQFAEPARGNLALQIFYLGAVFMLATLLSFGTIAWFAASFGKALQRSLSSQLWLNRAASVVFVGLALRLATTQR
jgi:threonine/homoserine/homoserine lactone efflux protein